MTITAAKYVSKDGYRLEYQVDGGPDWIHIKGFDHPDRAAVLAAIPDPTSHVTPEIPPDFITRYQLMQRLKATNNFATIKAFIDGLPDDDDAKLEALHQFFIKKEGALVTAIKAQLGLTDAQVDNFFYNAGKIE